MAVDRRFDFDRSPYGYRSRWVLLLVPAGLVAAGLLGRGGFTRFNLDGEAVLELGWVVRDALTGRGYATEIGRAALAWADEHEASTPVNAFTEVHNHASQAVMRRLGMRSAGLTRRKGLIEGQSGLHPDAPFALYRAP